MRQVYRREVTRRVYVMDYRVHHGAVGLVLFGVGCLLATRHPIPGAAVAGAGAALFAHDILDFPFRDIHNH